MTTTVSARPSFESQAEILKLARLLNRDPETLGYLEALPLQDLRRLRDQVTEVLFSSDQKTLMRLASASKLLPSAVTAAIAQRAFGPLLAARIAGLLEPARAVDVAAKLPPSFLADVAIELDPRRASDVIARIPPEQITAVTRELVSRGEYVAMGRFVGHLSKPAIEASLAAIDDGDLLRLGFVLEDKHRLDDVIDLLPSSRIEGMVVAADRENLWLEALDLLEYLDPAQRKGLAEAAIAKGDGVLDSLILAAERHELWTPLLKLESAISEQSRERFVRFVEERHPELAPRLRRGS